MGKKVGNGECTVLAASALRESGASIPPPDRAQDDNYAWGRLVTTISPDHPADAEILPGDILQFRDVRVFTVTRQNGAVRTSTRLYPHHTAIVSAVTGPNLRVLHQNVDDPKAPAVKRKAVREDPLRLVDLKKGTIWVYRPDLE